MKLRGYETKAVNQLPKLLKKHRRVCLVAPTGAGKTTITAAFLQRLRGKRVLWLAHRIELLRQAYDELLAAGGPKRDLGILNGEDKENEHARILIASVNMFRNRRVPKVDLVVIDEAHHAPARSYRKALRANRKAQVLGLTATPQRLDGLPLRPVFDHLYIVCEAAQLFSRPRYLLHAVIYGIPRDKARKLVKGAGGGKDYNDKKLERAMNKRPLIADCVKEKRRLAHGVRTLVYCCTRKHGRATEKRFAEAGYRTAYVDAKTPAARRLEVLGPNGLLARGKIEVVVNVGLITEGFNSPKVGCIICLRPTKSLTFWRQMCGRGARPSGRRAYYIVLDHAGNAWRHKWPDAPVEWSLDGKAIVKGEAPGKTCPHCGALNKMHATKCEVCGRALPKSDREVQEQAGDLEKLKRGLAEREALYKVLCRIAKKAGRPKLWARQELKRIAA